MVLAAGLRQSCTTQHLDPYRTPGTPFACRPSGSFRPPNKTKQKTKQKTCEPERALVGNGAGVFDHGAHALPVLHRRLRRRLCGGDVWNGSSVGSTGVSVGGGGGGKGKEEDETAFEAHAWEEGAPQVQLNGGSDPVVVTAAHVVSRGGGRGRGVRIRVRVYNATNARLHGFSVRLSFGHGGEAAGMGGGGRVQASVDEVRVREG